MEMTMRLPSSYCILNEEEMTYTSGGATAETLAVSYLIGFAFGTALRLYNHVDLVLKAREWCKENKTGDFEVDWGNRLEAFGDFMLTSPWNFVRGFWAFISTFTIEGALITGIGLLTV